MTVPTRRNRVWQTDFFALATSGAAEQVVHLAAGVFQGADRVARVWVGVTGPARTSLVA